jgi:hypothetical protein
VAASKIDPILLLRAAWLAIFCNFGPSAVV